MVPKLTRYVVGQDHDRAFAAAVYWLARPEGESVLLRRRVARLQRHRPSWRDQAAQAFRLCARAWDRAEHAAGNHRARVEVLA